jgi:hypothetical protein
VKRLVFFTVLAFVVLLLAMGGWIVGGIVACHRTLMTGHA